MWVHEVFDFEKYLYERNKKIIRHIFEKFEVQKIQPKFLEKMWQRFENNFDQKDGYFTKGISYDKDFFPDIPEQFHLTIPDSNALQPVKLPVAVRKNFAVDYAKYFIRFDLILREHYRKALLALYEYKRAAQEKSLAFLELPDACDVIPKETTYPSLAAHVTVMRLNLVNLNETGDNVFNRSQVNNDFIKLNLEIGKKLLPIEVGELDPENEGECELLEVYVPYWNSKTKPGPNFPILLQRSEATLLREATFDLGDKLLGIHTRPDFNAIAHEMCQNSFKVYLLTSCGFSSEECEYLNPSQLAADFIPQWIGRLHDALKTDLHKLALTIDFFYNVLSKYGINCDAQELIAYQMKVRGIDYLPRTT